MHPPVKHNNVCFFIWPAFGIWAALLANTVAMEIMLRSSVSGQTCCFHEVSVLFLRIILYDFVQHIAMFAFMTVCECRIGFLCFLSQFRWTFQGCMHFGLDTCEPEVCVCVCCWPGRRAERYPLTKHSSVVGNMLHSLADCYCSLECHNGIFSWGKGVCVFLTQVRLAILALHGFFSWSTKFCLKQNISSVIFLGQACLKVYTFKLC